MKLKVALLQTNVKIGNIEENEAAMKIILEKAMKDNPHVIVLPELWNMGYDLENLSSLAQKEKDSSLKLLKNFSKKHHIYIVGGSIGENKDGGYYNMMPLINPKGAVEVKYRKSHLFPLDLREEVFFEAGDQWGIGVIDEIPVGLMLCYDIRFPEFCRNLVLRGSRIVFVSAQWPKSRINHWRILLQSRAIENQIYIVATNRVGEDRSGLYGGHSLVIDPFGNILVEGSEEEEILSATLHLDVIDEVRSMIPALSQRLNILDEIDNNYF